MIAVIFEVWPKPEYKSKIFEIAAEPEADFSNPSRFISVERFESLTEKGKILSLSFFRDEEAGRGMAQCGGCHRRSQARVGQKFSIITGCAFAGVIRDYGLNDRAQVPRTVAPPTSRR